MRVACIRLEDGRTQNGQSDGWLRVGDEYTVLALETDIRGPRAEDRAVFRIADKRGGAPGLLGAYLFRVVDGRLPTAWHAIVNERGNLEIGPEAWLEPGYWERFFDSDPDAKREFEQAAQDIGC